MSYFHFLVDDVEPPEGHAYITQSTQPCVCLSPCEVLRHPKLRAMSPPLSDRRGILIFPTPPRDLSHSLSRRMFTSCSLPGPGGLGPVVVGELRVGGHCQDIALHCLRYKPVNHLLTESVLLTSIRVNPHDLFPLGQFGIISDHLKVIVTVNLFFVRY